MERIYEYESDGGRTVTVFDAGTTPVTFVVKCDAPGERAVSCPVPESFFADVFNRINLGENFKDLPSEYPAPFRALSDSDRSRASDQQA